MFDDETGPTMMTAGQLRDLLADVPPDLPIGVLTPDGDTCVVTSAAFGTVDWGRGAGPQTENRYLLLDTEDMPQRMLLYPKDGPPRDRSGPLTRRQVSALAEHMANVLSPAMRTEQPEPLAEAAWWAAKAMRRIAELLPADAGDEQPVDEASRAGLFGDVVTCTDSLRRAIHTQHAAEQPIAELARHTEDDVQADIGLGWNLALDGATARVTLPDAQTHVEVTLTKTPDGAWNWATDDLPLPLGPVTGHDHLELHTLLTSISTLVTGALHPDLLEER